MDASQDTMRLEVPSVGMRGGLGRVLLTAFLILAILPLSVVSWYATQRSRSNIQQEVTEKLSSIAAFKEAQIFRWVEERTAFLAWPEFTSQVDGVLAEMNVSREEARSRLANSAHQFGAELWLLDSDGRVVLASDAAWEGDILPLPENSDLMSTPDLAQISFYTDSQAGLVALCPGPEGAQSTYIVASRLPLQGLARILEETAGLGQTGEAYLVDRTGIKLSDRQRISSVAVDAVLAGQGGQGLYENYKGESVIGVYRWLPDLGMGLIVEQSQEEAFSGNDALVAAVIAATLGVAMATAVIAAFVTRQITRPLVELTESALRIASGDLSQRVEVNSRDEIGILAHVFNRMAGELEILYDDLESKVAERTRMLQQANYQIQRRAIQMKASVEVGQVVTSILDADELLEQVVHVIKDRFLHSYVAVYVFDEGHLLLRACAGEADPAHGECVPGDLPGPLGRALREGKAAVESHPVSVAVGPPISYTRSEVALPLRLGDRVLGVLDVQSTDEEDFDQDDVSVLQNVANQITIALENARAYAVEREVAERLRELDRSKRRFLANMSHELRTPLTNIIGFSRLMMKEMDGALSDRQKNDLQIIYHNGQHLLGLINDLLDVSQIEAGLMELELRQVDMGELIHSIMATANALVRGKPVVLREDIEPDLPMIWADPRRIRQVLLRLLANAAKFTEEGSITLRAWHSDGWIFVSVRDTGAGIPEQVRERIFERFEQGLLENGRRLDGAGLGLALSKEFLEMHGGSIWVESEVGGGSKFTASLPVQPPAPQQGQAVHINKDTNVEL